MQKRQLYSRAKCFCCRWIIAGLPTEALRPCCIYITASKCASGFFQWIFKCARKSSRTISAPNFFFATCFLNCSIFYLARLWPFQEIIIPSGSGSWRPVKRRNLHFGGHVVRKAGSKSSGVQLSSVVTQAHEVSTMDACPERPGHAWTFYAKSGRIGQYGIENDIPRDWDSQAACQNIPNFRK